MGVFVLISSPVVRLWLDIWMAYKFVGPKAWAEITAVVQSEGPRQAAVAFLGREAPTLMPLVKGDLLVCNASDSAVRSRSTSPDAIEAYLNAGVEVWSSAALHAKVIATSKQAIVGSANASTRSAEQTNEAAIIIDDKSMIDQIAQFVVAARDDLDHSDQVSFTDLPRLRALWDEGQWADQRFGVPGVNKSIDELISNANAEFFISRASEVDIDETVIAKVNRKIRRTHRTTGFATAFMTIEEDDTDADLNIGDIMFWWDGDGIEPPAVVIDVPRPLDDGTGRSYQSYRFREDLDWFSWEQLCEELPASLWSMLDHDDLRIVGNLSETTKLGSLTKKAKLAQALLQLWGLELPPVHSI